MTEFILAKALERAIKKSADESKGVDKKILENVLRKLIENTRTSNLTDEDINTLFLQVEANLKEAE